MDHDHLTSICENCSEELRGQFCSSCGQRVGTLPNGVFSHLRWLVSGILGNDSRVLRSLGSVLLFDSKKGVTITVSMNQGRGAEHFALAPELLRLATD